MRLDTGRGRARRRGCRIDRQTDRQAHRLHINCRSEDGLETGHGAGLGWWELGSICLAICYLLWCGAFVGGFFSVLFSFMLFKCFIKIAYGHGSGSLSGSVPDACHLWLGRTDLCQRHQARHTQQQKSIRNTKSIFQIHVQSAKKAKHKKRTTTYEKKHI